MTDTEEKIELPRREQAEPFQGFKAVSLTLNQGKIQIHGSYRVVDLDGTAECHKYPKPDEPHVAPDLDCVCGFYAVPTREKARDYYSGNVVATVDLFGFVIVGEDGWRASRQRILALEIPTICEACAMMHDDRSRSDAVYFDITSHLHTLCAEHGELSSRLNATRRYTTADIAAAAGVEVGWLHV